MNHKSWSITGLIATAVIALSIPLSLLVNRPAGEVWKPEAVFTGGHACIECHQPEYRLWKESDHSKAMMVATDSTVAGDFNNAELIFNGKTSRFFRRDGKFMVFTEGVGGQMKEFEVKYTFGIRPLQQYLVPFESGRYQCLPIAWNTLKNEWFHMAAMVYDPEDLEPESWLYWTNQSQNWNSMCAECHSTNLQKNFDLETKSYHTTWVDISVNCEACHGPGSLHIEWAQLPEMGRPQNVNTGLVLQTSNLTSRQYVESCAPCHSRRSSMGANDHRSSDFYSYAVPQLPMRPNYHVDGQIHEEVFDWGSFTQSKMYMNDVFCGDCHDPHSSKPLLEGNALCTQCHIEEQYNTFNHHFHKAKGEDGITFVNKSGVKLGPGDGNLCRDCHMPGQYYMGIDKRFDHSMRIPRPDLSIQLGTPNACINCHDGETNEWALENINKWYGKAKKAHYATILADAYERKPNADQGLIRLINNDLYPEIIRATAISYLSGYDNQNAKETIRRLLNNPDPLLRYMAANNYSPADSSILLTNLLPLLSDPVKSVRIEAASRLLTFNDSAFNEFQLAAFRNAVEEYRQSLEWAADFPAGRYNLGNYYSKMNDRPKAMENYAEALALDRLFYPARINLGIQSYAEGKTELADRLFSEMIRFHPEMTEGYYYLALLYAEQKRNSEAITLLETAVSLPNANPRIFYNLGLLYQSTGQDMKSGATFEKGLVLDPCNFDLLYALFVFNLNRNDRTKASIYVEKLIQCYPDEASVQSLYRDFKRGA